MQVGRMVDFDPSSERTCKTLSGKNVEFYTVYHDPTGSWKLTMRNVKKKILVNLK